MIGPGTGIAPFRAFLWEREATGAEGENWLFFGEHDFVKDFYYQTELQAWKEQGLLTEISLGFEKNSLHNHSMDTLVRKHGVALWQWITRGASLFVSGEKEPMCRLVEDALIEVISQHGNMPLPTASDTLKRLAKEGRYAKDVY